MPPHDGVAFKSSIVPPRAGLLFAYTKDSMAQSRWFRYVLNSQGIARFPGIGNQVYVRGNGGAQLVVWNGGDMISYINLDDAKALMSCLVVVPHDQQQPLHNKFAKCMNYHRRKKP
jgi:hypothetical protein